MAEIARRYSARPEIRLLAQSLCQRRAQKDNMGEIIDCFTFVRDNIRYVKDPVGVELIFTPDKLLEYGAGDCDDKSTLLATLLMSIGHKARFVALDQGAGYCHVWVQVLCKGKWLDLETTEPCFAGQCVPLKSHYKLLYFGI